MNTKNNTSKFRRASLSGLNKIDGADWNRLTGSITPSYVTRVPSCPGSSGCVRENRWQPHHLVVYQAKQLVALMPLYIKTHSYGEYVLIGPGPTPTTVMCSILSKIIDRYTLHASNRFTLWLQRSQNDAEISQLAVEKIKQLRRPKAILGISTLSPQSEFEQLFQHNPICSQRLSIPLENRDYVPISMIFSHTSARVNAKILSAERRRVAEQGITLARMPGTEITHLAAKHSMTSISPPITSEDNRAILIWRF